MNIYIMPITLHQGPLGRAPKYRETHLATFRVQSIPYGNEDWCICRAFNEGDSTSHDLLVAETDVYFIPKPYSTPLGGAAQAVINKLTAVGMPSDWIDGTTTRRQVLRMMAKYCHFMSKLEVLVGDLTVKLLSGGRTLDTTMDQLTTAMKQKLRGVAESFGFVTDDITGTSTIRDVLTSFAAQWTIPSFVVEEE